MVFFLYFKSIIIHEHCNFSTHFHPLHYSVPRESVFGPFLFSIYILPIHDIIDIFSDVYYHIYTDNIQPYSLLFRSSNVLPDNYQLCKCASTIISWYLSNNILLNLNPSISSLLDTPSNYHCCPSVVLNGYLICPSSSVISVGVTQRPLS